MIGLSGGEMLVIFLVFLVPTVLALVDLLRTPAATWAEARENQGVWALVVLLIQVIGPILYFLMARPKLRAVRSTESTGSGRSAHI